MFLGYYKNEQATAETLQDGWLLSGDAGYFDETGRLRGHRPREGRDASGRRHALLPAVPGKQAQVLALRARGRGAGPGTGPMVAAIVCIDMNIVGHWAEGQLITYTTYQDLAAKDQIYGLIQGEIEKINEGLPKATRYPALRPALQGGWTPTTANSPAPARCAGAPSTTVTGRSSRPCTPDTCKPEAGDGHPVPGRARAGDVRHHPHPDRGGRISPWNTIFSSSSTAWWSAASTASWPWASWSSTRPPRWSTSPRARWSWSAPTSASGSRCSWPLPFVWAFLMTLAFSVLLGLAVERLALRPLIGESHICVIMVTIGPVLGAQESGAARLGHADQGLPRGAAKHPGGHRRDARGPGVHRGLRLVRPALRLCSPCSSSTRAWAIAMRATAHDQQAAQSMGIGIRGIFAPVLVHRQRCLHRGRGYPREHQRHQLPFGRAGPQGLPGGDPGRPGQPAGRRPGRAHHRRPGEHLRRPGQGPVRPGGLPRSGGLRGPGGHPHDQALRPLRHRRDRAGCRPCAASADCSSKATGQRPRSSRAASRRSAWGCSWRCCFCAPWCWTATSSRS